jgi:signal peptidase I
LLSAVVALLLLTQRPYRVAGRSMEPALVEGDWLMLENAAPRAGDLVVLREPDSGDLAVKRVGAEPGENVQIVGADVWRDGAVHARPLNGVEDLVPMLDARGADLERELNLGAAGFTAADDRWRLPSGESQVFLRRPPGAGYFLRGEQVSLAQPGLDLGLELEYALLGPAAEVHLHLRLGRTVFSARLGDGGRIVHVERRDAGGEPETLHRVSLSAARMQDRIFFCLVDRRLTLRIGDLTVVPGEPFAPPTPLLLADGPDSLGMAAHAGIGGVGPLEIGRLRLGRDVLYDPAGTYGGGAGFHLGPDEFFVLGDNPPLSRDSRHYGAVPRDHILGVVSRRLWPTGWSARGWSIE